MYLVDSCVFLELLLDQEQADAAEEFFGLAPTGSLHLSDFAFHSVGVILFSKGEHDVFLRFVEDVLVNACLQVVALSVGDMQAVADAARTHGLDFDDAYQYVPAKNRGLQVVSFDSDFDRTDIGRLTPAQAAGQIRGQAGTS